jgi:hypothetical protein
VLRKSRLRKRIVRRKEKATRDTKESKEEPISVTK